MLRGAVVFDAVEFVLFEAVAAFFIATVFRLAESDAAAGKLVLSEAAVGAVSVAALLAAGG